MIHNASVTLKCCLADVKKSEMNFKSSPTKWQTSKYEQKKVAQCKVHLHANINNTKSKCFPDTAKEEKTQNSHTQYKTPKTTWVWSSQRTPSLALNIRFFFTLTCNQFKILGYLQPWTIALFWVHVVLSSRCAFSFPSIITFDFGGISVEIGSVAFWWSLIDLS
jgi:hypothetical protein